MALEASVKDRSTKPTFAEKYTEFLRKLRFQVHTDNDDRVNWKNKMIIANNQRLGVKRYSNYPYPGAPDIPLPETDKLIKKSIPNLVLSAWAPKKMCVVKVKDGVQETEELAAKARKAELAINMYLRSKDMDWFKKLMLAADNRKQYGHCIFKIYEKFKCRQVSKVIDLEDFGEEVEQLKGLNRPELSAFVAERYDLDLEDEDEKAIIDDVVNQFKSGEQVIEFTVPEYTSMPVVDIVDPINLTVPAYTQEINIATRIREQFFLPKHTIEQLIEDGIFLKKDMEEIPTWNGEEELINSVKSRNEGITDNTSRTDLYRFEMISTWYKDKENEPYRRKLFTFFADVIDIEIALVQDIDFPFEFEGWFYEKDDNETKDSRYYASRGVPEQIRAIQEIMERCINNTIIRDEMLNTPMWEVLDTSQIMDAHVRMIPGAKLPVRALGQEINQINQFPKADTASNQIMTVLKAYVEEYLSVSDQLFRNATNQGGGKTLGEINIGIQQNSGPLNLEVISWNETLSRVYQKIFYILRERVGDSIYIEGEEITREDFNFPAEVKSNGDLEVANEQLATQKASMRLQVILNPALQDIVNSEDRYNALRDWLEKDGVKDPDQFCTNPIEIAQGQIAQMQQQKQQMMQEMQGMQAEQQAGIKQIQQQKRQKQKTEAETKEAENYNQEQDLKAAENFGNEVGSELFATTG